MPWRARRHYDPRDSAVYHELFLPQIGDYLNHGYDANAPEDLAHWHHDVAAFVASAMALVHHEGCLVARETQRLEKQAVTL